MFNGMPEGGGGAGEGYVPVAGGAKGSIQQRVQIFLGETVTQCSFQLATDHFFSFCHTWTVFSISFFVIFDIAR